MLVSHAFQILNFWEKEQCRLTHLRLDGASRKVGLITISIDMYLYHDLFLTSPPITPWHDTIAYDDPTITFRIPPHIAFSRTIEDEQ